MIIQTDAVIPEHCEDINNTIIAEIRAFVLLRYFYTNEET